LAFIHIKSAAMKKGIVLLIIVTSFTTQSAYTQFSRFSAKILSAYSVALEWRTMMESKTDHFVVQRSNNGAIFEDLGTVQTLLTDSTNAYELIYSYTDKSALPGTSYYRIQLIKKDGRSAFTSVVRLVNDQSEGIKIFPTVVQNSSLFVESAKSLKNARLELFDLSGKKFSETRWDELNGRQTFYISKMKNGTYLAKLSANGKDVLNQLVILQ
jgi:hypothetical protein